MVSRRLQRWQARGTATTAGAVLLLAAAGPGHAAAPDAGAVLRITGPALVHAFDLTAPGDHVTGEWVVAADRPDVAYDGVLEVHAPSTAPLAHALVVEYGRTAPDGSVLSWHDAGTVAEPLTYGAALGIGPTARAHAPTRIPVRVSLPDPGPVRHALDGDDALVEATFTVSYLADGHGAGPPGQAPADDPAPSGPAVAASGPGGALAVTGTGFAAVAVVGALLAAGVALARAARRARVAGDVPVARP